MEIRRPCNPHTADIGADTGSNRIYHAQKDMHWGIAVMALTRDIMHIERII